VLNTSDELVKTAAARSDDDLFWQATEQHLAALQQLSQQEERRRKRSYDWSVQMRPFKRQCNYPLAKVVVSRPHAKTIRVHSAELDGGFDGAMLWSRRTSERQDVKAGTRRLIGNMDSYNAAIDLVLPEGHSEVVLLVLRPVRVVRKDNSAEASDSKVTKKTKAGKETKVASSTGGSNSDDDSGRKEDKKKKPKEFSGCHVLPIALADLEVKVDGAQKTFVLPDPVATGHGKFNNDVALWDGAVPRCPASQAAHGRNLQDLWAAIDTWPEWSSQRRL